MAGPKRNYASDHDVEEVPAAKFLHVTSTTRDGIERDHVVRVDMVVAANAHNGMTVITVQGSDYQIWANIGFDEFMRLMADAGATFLEQEVV